MAAPAEAQDEPQVCEMSPARGADTLFVSWSTDPSVPELEVDVPSHGDAIEVEFLLDLRTGRQSWTTRMSPAPRTTEVLLPIPPAADLALRDEPGMLSALAWHYNAAGETIFAHATEAIPVTLSGGLLTHRVVVPVRTQLEVDGVLVDFFDRGEVGTVQQVIGRWQPPADEVEVDHEE